MTNPTETTTPITAAKNEAAEAAKMFADTASREIERVLRSDRTIENLQRLRRAQRLINEAVEQMSVSRQLAALENK